MQIQGEGSNTGYTYDTDRSTVVTGIEEVGYLEDQCDVYITTDADNSKYYISAICSYDSSV